MSTSRLSFVSATALQDLRFSNSATKSAHPSALTAAREYKSLLSQLSGSPKTRLVLFSVPKTSRSHIKDRSTLSLCAGRRYRYPDLWGLRLARWSLQWAHSAVRRSTFLFGHNKVFSVLLVT